MLLDKNTVLQIFGSLMKNPTLLTEVDKYTLYPSDFTSSFERYIYGAIYNLFSAGVEKISVVDIDTYLKEYPGIYETFKNNKGVEYLQDAFDISQEENFGFYYTKLKKYNAIKDLSSIGIKTDWIYPEDEFDKDYDKKIKNFEATSVLDIFNLVRVKLSEVESKYGSATVESIYANYKLEELLSKLKESPDVGPNLQGDIFNTVVRGARPGTYYLRSAGTGIGKALPNSTLIPTPNGWRRVGDIQVGDYLFGQDGKMTKVLQTYPQNEQKEVWEVRFADGRVVKCCKDHLWKYRYSQEGGHRVETTEEIYNRTLKFEEGFKRKRGFRFHIQLNNAVEYEEKEFSLPPYVMGAILGDGSFRYDKSNKAFSFSSKDSEIPNYIGELIGYVPKKNSEFNYNYTFKKELTEKHNLWVEEILKDYPSLWQVKSEDKFIPEEYLLGSVEQRYQLLQGLLDTDGSIDVKGRVSFSTISPFLRDNVIELCRSLGFIANYLTDKREKYSTGEVYSVHIQCRKELKPLLFKVKHKKERAIEYAASVKREEYKTHLAIVDIKKTTDKTDMTCFTVDNDEHLFLANDFIVTHNTRSLVGDSCYLAYPVRYNPARKEWEKNGSSNKVLYVATEQKPVEIQTMVLAYLTGINEEKFLLGTYTEEEEKVIKTAIQIMKKYEENLTIVRLPDPCMAQIKLVFRQYCLQKGIKFVFYDYIFSSPALLNEYRDLGVREDVILGHLSTLLKDMAAELNAFVMTSTQITGDLTAAKGIRNQSYLRGSKAIADKADGGFITAITTKEEQDLLVSIVSKIGKMPNQVTDVYKIRGGRFKDVRIWSYMDLGTCRKEDLLITNEQYNPVEEFAVIKFQFEEPDYTEEINIYNKQESNEKKKIPIWTDDF